MEWPAQSPDRDQIATKVEEENPTNVEQLWRAVKTVWEGLPQERLATLIESMPRRCEGVNFVVIVTF